MADENIKCANEVVTLFIKCFGMYTTNLKYVREVNKIQWNVITTKTYTLYQLQFLTICQNSIKKNGWILKRSFSFDK